VARVDTQGLNWRGVVVFGLAVLTVIVLIAVIDDQPATLGINTVAAPDDTGTVASTTTVPGASSTTVAGGTGSSTTTTKPGSPTTTTKPGTPTTTAFNPAGKPQLQQGSTGADVVFLQDQLKRLNYLTGTSDGAFGAGTTAAVIKFQNDKKITPADGVVGPTTWAALSTATP
jgi:peptidoglycan hydrolase-like protein with peptidoglycan-binding domain